MTWTDIQTAWNDFADDIMAHWPELHGEKVVAIAGDRAEFARYLSTSYDLTLAEAADVIDTWIRRITAKVDAAKGAAAA